MMNNTIMHTVALHAMNTARWRYLSEAQATRKVYMAANAYGGAERMRDSSTLKPPPERMTGRKSATRKRGQSMRRSEGRRRTREGVGGHGGGHCEEKERVRNTGCRKAEQIVSRTATH